jgi:hypothetical protein
LNEFLTPLKGTRRDGGCLAIPPSNTRASLQEGSSTALKMICSKKSDCKSICCSFCSRNNPVRFFGFSGNPPVLPVLKLYLPHYSGSGHITFSTGGRGQANTGLHTRNHVYAVTSKSPLVGNSMLEASVTFISSQLPNVVGTKLADDMCSPPRLCSSQSKFEGGPTRST